MLKIIYNKRKNSSSYHNNPLMQINKITKAHEPQLRPICKKITPTIEAQVLRIKSSQYHPHSV